MTDNKNLYEMTPYQHYISKSRYSRFLDKEGRREHWPETVERYFDFMASHLLDKHSYTLQPVLRERLQAAVTALKVVPSMRSIMTAGEALERQNIAGYNCSYLPIDDPKAFDEAMYILLCGTGVGYSVEQKYVSKLPEVPEALYNSNTVIGVKDSKEGWAKSLRQVIALLYAGEIPKWDVSAVRPAGARLKTFGGRASGPEPLVDLFKYVVAKFKGAVGRKLTSLEAHDILCKVGEVVVVGGVRRSAMISLSDLPDDRMAMAKSGNWWDGNGQRALANNSAVYETKPDVGKFMREWSSIYESHSGERGIFNRYASDLQAARNGRRETGQEWGTNPCSEIILRPFQFCNLSSVIVRPEDTEETLLDKIEMATILGTFQSTMTSFPYLRKIWQKNTEEERLLGVSMTGPLDNKLLNNPEDANLPGLLERLKERAINTNKQYADFIGITASVAITAIKPEGTVSQLAGTASGLHPQHSSFFIRRVRSDNKDPLTDFLKASGFPSEPCVMKPETTTVFSFPVKVKEGALLREELDAVSHLKLWLLYQRHYCEHKPSVTISVQEHEWPIVGAKVWENFDEITGVSFLPMDGGTYRQAPYETITEDEYKAMEAEMPKSINWASFIENTDNVEGAQMLACTAGACEI
ncbi:RTPR, ribonucleoside-triphosphate reductase, adenosylcobalamin-dependent [uncultured Caudovirales phage]|uniref:RTPR, ribonucleoside-triphosphate reductase, adenosylcobalamin-dependent n=1 Tax=uncultured Caudovirales phage TaxID=2100421 RepID=A0A6J7WXX0_9CAUD|nr:RTPR, ribonucleoside-triphosphate reductase, adenosylcobalamin-dependent [uncultured Caudovirales phage]